MWIYLSIVSAVMLGVYDVAKKAAVQKNSVMWVLFATTSLSALFLLPFYEGGSAGDFLMLLPKTLLVSLSWISGLEGMRLLPLTTSSTIKASRPVFVVLCSIFIFGESLNDWQWTGVVISLGALWLLSRSSRKEGIYFSNNAGIWWMILSVATGVASALYDKYIMKGLSPNFVQSWSSLFIAVFMGLVLLWQTARKGQSQPFKWDYSLLVVALCILCADMAYFNALKEPGAMLSVISLLRRGCAIVSFILGSILFKEKNLGSKAVDLGLLLIGMTILALAS